MSELQVNLEEFRRQYRPSQIKVLFVGESPPAGGTFFYKGDSGLARYTKLAFQRAYSLPDLAIADFLHEFKAAGCYLDDLCLEPVNRMKASDRRAAWKSELEPFAGRLAADSPRIIVPILRSIESSVRQAAESAGFWTACEARFHIQAWATIRAISRNCRACSLSFAKLPFCLCIFCNKLQF